MKNKRLLQSLDFIDEKYVKEAEPKMTTSTFSFAKTFKRVACLVLVMALGLFLFIPIKNTPPDVTMYAGSEYYPIIERIADFRYSPSPYKNNFQYITAEVGDLFDNFKKMDMDGALNGGAAAPEFDAAGSNGSYVESTDNQVAGVVEADLMKRTDKYIFRLTLAGLDVYTIAKEDSARIASFILPGYEDEGSSRNYQREMYLSEDGNTVTIVSQYYNKNYNSKIRLISIDVSDLENINVKKTVSIDGSLNSTRMIDGRLLLISEFKAAANEIDYSNPETYVPSITTGDVTECIRFEDIIYPNEIDSTRYSVIALIEEDTLELIKAHALLDFYSDVYVSLNNVYVTKEYTKQDIIGNNGAYVSRNMCDIAVLNYVEEALEYKGTFTVEGLVKDQYSMDEYEGYFRVVTSTDSFTNARGTGDLKAAEEIIGTVRESANLTVFNLETLEKAAEIRHFAPEGEEAVSVRFDGDKAYVCTAVVVTFTDPVYFFDLSDYSSVTYTDTGVIDGFSSSLIQLGDGYLLGIGEENWSSGKVEVYEEQDGAVVSVDKYLINGSYSRDYKAYYVNRETDMFGLGVMHMYDEQTGKEYNCYLLLAFNGYEIVEVAKVQMNISYTDRIRAFIDSGYLYITDDNKIKIVNLSEAQ